MEISWIEDAVTGRPKELRLVAGTGGEELFLQRMLEQLLAGRLSILHSGEQRTMTWTGNVESP